MTTFDKKTLSTREYEAFREAENNLTKKAVVVENSEPIPTEEYNGLPLYLFESDITDAGQEKEILNVVANNLSVQRRIKSFGVSCHIEGTLRLYHNNNFIGATRTNASKCDSVFSFEPYLVLNDQLKLTFEARPNSINANVECFIMGNLI